MLNETVEAFAGRQAVVQISATAQREAAVRAREEAITARERTLQAKEADIKASSAILANALVEVSQVSDWTIGPR